MATTVLYFWLLQHCTFGYCSTVLGSTVLSGSSSIFSFLSKSVKQDLDSDNGQWTKDSESSPNPLDSAESESESTDSVVHYSECSWKCHYSEDSSSSGLFLFPIRIYFDSRSLSFHSLTCRAEEDFLSVL